MRSIRFRLVALAWIACAAPAGAESGYEAWLRYPRIANAATLAQYDAVPSEIVLLGSSPVLQSSRDELARGLGSMLGRTFKTGTALGATDAIVVGTADALHGTVKEIAADDLKTPGAFYLLNVTRGRQHLVVIAGADDRGVLVRRVCAAPAGRDRLPDGALDDRQAPAAPLRWVNEWNNLDGTIERGYGGRVDLLRGRSRPRRI